MEESFNRTKQSMNTPTMLSPTPTTSAHYLVDVVDRNGQQQKISNKPILYPDSDGKPMADNTKQFRIIVTLHNGFEALYKDDPNVFVAGDLLWYPVEGNNKLRTAPDVMIAYGRPKGDRGSYKQWEEGGIAPQIVFEILSPGNRLTEMAQKLAFYAHYGVAEYYIYDPDRIDLSGWVRSEQGLEVIPEMQGWVSPRAGVRFEVIDDELVLYRPDGQKFETYQELLVRAEQERSRAEQESLRAEQERNRAEQESLRAEQERTRAERLAEQLRTLGIDSL
jgi:Uma2 family endonuclease